MADVTIGELPALSTMEADTLIPVEHDGSAKSMAGSVLQTYVYGLVEDDVETISEIIAVGPQGPNGVSPTLSASKSGKVTTIYFTDADHTSETVLATINDGQDGTGIGDMVMAVYDQDENGIVDNSERLGGQPASYFQAAAEKGAANGLATLDANLKVTQSQTSARLVTVSESRNIAGSDLGAVLKASGTITLSIPTDLGGDSDNNRPEIEILNIGSGTITIAAASSSVTINGSAGGSKTIPVQYTAAVLKAMGANEWVILGDIV